MTTFSDLGVASDIVDALAGKGIIDAFPIQEQTLPLALSGQDIIFAAAGVTEGTLMKGVRFFGEGIRTSSLIMQTNPHRIRFIDSIQVYPGPAVKIRF